MERLPLSARIGPPAEQRYSSQDEEREGGEISETERSRERDFRDRDRYRERDWERSRRDDVYYSSRAPYDREGRHWDNDRGRDRSRDREYDRRDDREWTRDTGRGRYYREPRGGWRDDRDRIYDRYYERDRDRERRVTYDRPRERDAWPRDDRRRDDVYTGKSDWDSTYRPGADDQYRPSPRKSPERAYRNERERSTSRSRGDGGYRASRRREDSIESRGSGARRFADDRERIAYARKRERSRSPLDSDSGSQRRQRTDSPSLLGDRRRGPSPTSRRREEKRPEHWSPSHTNSQSTSDMAAYRRSAPEPIRRSQTPPAQDKQVARPHLMNLSESTKSSLETRAHPARNSPAPSPVVASDKPIRPDLIRRSSTITPPQMPRSPAKLLEIPINTPSGPRSVGMQPPPPRLPKIPEYKGRFFSHGMELDRLNEARISLYLSCSRANYELFRAKIDTEISAIELRSAEQRRILAEQQRRLAQET